MTVKIEDIKVGDDVSVKLRVLEINTLEKGGRVFFRCAWPNLAMPVWITASDISEHHPALKTFKVGDWVTWGTKESAWQISCIDNDVAIVRSQSKIRALAVFLNELSHDDAATPRA